MRPLREELGRFIAQLREAGVRISVAESLDAMNAVAAVGLDRIRMREALATSLIKDEADRVRFDEVFGRFFAAPPSRGAGKRHPDHQGAQQSAASGQGRPGENPPLEVHQPKRKDETNRAGQRGEAKRAESQDHPVEKSKADDRDSSSPQNRERGSPTRSETESLEGFRQESAIEGARMAQMREAEQRPFSAYTDLEFRQAREALKPLERRFRIRVGRRLRLARRGRIDFRRTIRAGIQHGGLLAELKFRARRPRRVDLVILADVSGSVRYAAELILELAAGAQDCFHRVTSFVYIDRLAEASFEQGHLVTSPALDLYARSDFGRVLVQLWERRAEVLNRQTLVVILGDGRNNRRPARADILKEISRICRGVVWLNPEEPARWGSGDSAIEQYRAAVTALYASGNLHELERGLVAAC